MKIWYKLILGILTAACLLAGCGEKNRQQFKQESTAASETEENLFEQNENTEPVQEVNGMFHMELIWEEDSNGNRVFLYQGGKKEISVLMNVTGNLTSEGFMLFLDGEPQPFSIKEQSSQEDFIQTMQFPDGKDTTFTIVFTPTTGTKNDKLDIAVCSISDPDFHPDMKTTQEYGLAHSFAACHGNIIFQENAATNPVQTKTQSSGSRLQIQETQISDSELERFTEDGKLIMLNQDIHTELYIDDNDMLLERNYPVNNKEKMHIKYRIMGYPGKKVKTVFFLKHQPVLIDGKYSVDTELKNGLSEDIEFDLNVSDLTGKTFYAISIPNNVDADLDGTFSPIKSNSIWLYRNAGE